MCEEAYAALDAILQGSTIRAYGIKFEMHMVPGRFRASIALTNEQRELVKAAMDAR